MPDVKAQTPLDEFRVGHLAASLPRLYPCSPPLPHTLLHCSASSLHPTEGFTTPERRSWKRSLLLVACITVLFLPGLISPAQARVSWVEITERVPFAGGMPFGKVGPYEKIRGRLHYAVDPENRFNEKIVDLQLAKTGQLRQDVSVVTPAGVREVIGGDARNAKGDVEFWGEFILLKPVDSAKGKRPPKGTPKGT